MKVDEVTDLAVLAGVNTTLLDEPIATVELLQARAEQAEEMEAAMEALVALDEPDQEQADSTMPPADEDFAPPAFPDGLLPEEPPDDAQELEPKKRSPMS